MSSHWPWLQKTLRKREVTLSRISVYIVVIIVTCHTIRWKLKENEGTLWKVGGNLIWFLWPRNEDKWRCNRAKEEGKIEQISLANSFFLEARTRKRERGREGGLSRLECLKMSLNAALLRFILHFLKGAWKQPEVVENILWFTRWNSENIFKIQKIFLTSNSDFANLPLTSDGSL